MMFKFLLLFIILIPWLSLKARETPPPEPIIDKSQLIIYTKIKLKKKGKYKEYCSFLIDRSITRDVDLVDMGKKLQKDCERFVNSIPAIQDHNFMKRSKIYKYFLVAAKTIKQSQDANESKSIQVRFRLAIRENDLCRLDKKKLKLKFNPKFNPLWKDGSYSKIGKVIKDITGQKPKRVDIQYVDNINKFSITEDTYLFLLFTKDYKLNGRKLKKNNKPPKLTSSTLYVPVIKSTQKPGTKKHVQKSHHIQPVRIWRNFKLTTIFSDFKEYFGESKLLTKREIYDLNFEFGSIEKDRRGDFQEQQGRIYFAIKHDRGVKKCTFNTKIIKYRGEMFFHSVLEDLVIKKPAPKVIDFRFCRHSILKWKRFKNHLPQQFLQLTDEIAGTTKRGKKCKYDNALIKLTKRNIHNYPYYRVLYINYMKKDKLAALNINKKIKRLRTWKKSFFRKMEKTERLLKIKDFKKPGIEISLIKSINDSYLKPMKNLCLSN